MKITLNKTQWQYIGKKAGWIKKAEINTESAINGKSKQAAKNFIYKITQNLTKGFFRDEAWENVQKIWETLSSQYGIDVIINNAEYRNGENSIPTAKKWGIEIPFIDNKGKERKLVGYLIASFCGEMNDPTSRYDLVLILS